MNIPFRNPELDPRRWSRSGDWQAESREAAFGRAPEFGRRFLAGLLTDVPEPADVRFLRWSVQSDDVYVVIDRPHGFVVQIDPDLEYLIVFDPDSHAEFGDWGTDHVRDALDYVRQQFLGRAAEGDAP